MSFHWDTVPTLLSISQWPCSGLAFLFLPHVKSGCGPSLVGLSHTAVSLCCGLTMPVLTRCLCPALPLPEELLSSLWHPWGLRWHITLHQSLFCPLSINHPPVRVRVHRGLPQGTCCNFQWFMCWVVFLCIIRLCHRDGNTMKPKTVKRLTHHHPTHTTWSINIFK